MPRTASEALEMVRPHVNEEVFEVLSGHVKLRAKCKGRRFPLWLKKFALQLNFRGPRAYRFLSSCLTLPCVGSLRRRLSHAHMRPGIAPGVISSILTKTQSWNKRDCVCTLVFDEMVLKNLFYDVAQDVVHRFTDDGSERTSTTAERAMVVLLSGISRMWVHPAAYTNGHINLMVSLMEQLKEIGVTVKAMTCDQGASL